MGSILLSTILDEVRADSQDVDIDDWTEARLIAFANNVSRDIAIFKPDASVDNDSVQLAAGIKQSIPSTSLGLIRLIRNMGTDGVTPGNGIVLIQDMDYFTRMNPTWPVASTSATVECYFYDKRNPNIFFVYPPQPSSGMGYVEMDNITTPTEMTETTDAIPLSDIYSEAYKAGILSYCYRLDKYIRSYPGIWQSHYNAFLTLLGAKEENETATEPS